METITITIACVPLKYAKVVKIRLRFSILKLMQFTAEIIAQYTYTHHTYLPLQLHQPLLQLYFFLPAIPASNKILFACGVMQVNGLVEVCLAQDRVSQLAVIGQSY